MKENVKSNTYLNTSTVNSRSEYLNLIRGFTCIYVLLCHIIPWSLSVQPSNKLLSFINYSLSAIIKIFQTHGETNLGVLIFIVLSGYCIHRNGLRDVNTSTLKTYFKKRIARIIPIYMLATFVGIVLFLNSNNVDMTMSLSGTTGITLKNTIIKLLSINSIIPAFHTLSFNGNAPLTTVSTEIFLYILYPIIVIFSIRNKKEHITYYICALAWMGGIALCSLDPSYFSWWNNGSLLGFLIYWWVGAFCVNQKVIAKLSKQKWVLILTWFAITLLLNFAPITIFPIIVLATEIRKLLLALLIGYLIGFLDSKKNDMKQNIFCKIGEAGYSIYALHAPIAIFLIGLKVNYIIIILLCLIIGIVVNKLIENKMRHLIMKI